MASRQRGIALIMVLWALVLLAVIGASVTRESRTQARIARNVVDSAAAEALANAGVYRAMEGLANTGREGALRVDGTVYGWSFGGGEVRLRITDEGGKVDLNAATEPLLGNLFSAAGLAPDAAASLAAAVVDWRDGDDLVRPGGAEAAEYADAGITPGPKNAPFEAVEELTGVIGMTPQLFARLAGALTVESRRRAPDPALAPPLVAAALAGGAPEPGEPGDGGSEPAGNEASEAGAAGDLRILALGPTARRSRARAYTIEAEGLAANGARFLREAVVRVPGPGGRPYQIELWRHGRGGPALAPSPGVNEKSP